jgi:hypothetical protein
MRTELQFTSGRKEAIEAELASKQNEQTMQLQSKDEMIQKVQTQPPRKNTCCDINFK